MGTLGGALKDFPRLLDGYVKLSPEILTFSVAILLLSLVFQFWRSSKSKQGLLPPGRLGLPFIGETREFLQTQKSNRSWEFVESRVAKHGEIFKTRLLGDPTVVLSSPSGNRLLFTNENKLVNVSSPESVFSVLGKHSLTGMRGDEAKRMRQALMTFLRPEALQMFTARADASVRKFLDEYWEGKEQVMVHDTMNRCIFSLACQLMVSRYDKAEQKKLEKMFTPLNKGILQLPINLPGTRFYKAVAASTMLRNQFTPWLEERRMELKAGTVSSDHDLLSCLLSYRDEDGQPLSDADIKDNILLVLYAGHDSTNAVMTMVCKFLAENQEVCEDIWKEQHEIAAGKSPDEPLNWADTQRMKLSWRAVQETLRLQPPAQGTFRIAIKDIDYGGYRIPKGWKLYWSVNSTHRNAKYFSEPEKFDPSRFEGAGPSPYTFVPFGGGPRMCPGNEFVKMELLVVLHHLVLRYKWRLVYPEEEISLDPMPCPKKALPIWLERRAQ